MKDFIIFVTMSLYRLGSNFSYGDFICYKINIYSFANINFPFKVRKRQKFKKQNQNNTNKSRTNFLSKIRIN